MNCLFIKILLPYISLTSYIFQISKEDSVERSITQAKLERQKRAVEEDDEVFEPYVPYPPYVPASYSPESSGTKVNSTSPDMQSTTSHDTPDGTRKIKSPPTEEASDSWPNDYNVMNNNVAEPDIEQFRKEGAIPKRAFKSYCAESPLSNVTDMQSGSENSAYLVNESDSVQSELNYPEDLMTPKAQEEDLSDLDQSDTVKIIDSPDQSANDAYFPIPRTSIAEPEDDLLIDDV